MPAPIRRLIAELTRLPGVGEKTATRYVLFWLQRSPNAMRDLADRLAEAASSVRPCVVCGYVAEGDRCGFCEDPARDSTTLCVVEGVADVLAIERIGEYRGLYHVLGGVLSALRGVGPEHLRVDGLLDRVASGEVREVVLATGANAEGETTALYLARILADRGVRVTRPATGIPMGSSIEYLDAVTLMKAFRGRREIVG